MENKLKKYYLGTLPQAETEAIDLQLMAEADFEEDLLLAKNNLMEEFLDQSLSPEEIKSFQQNFLKTEERKKELENLALLREYAFSKQAEKSIAEKPKESSASFFDRLNKFFAMNLRPLAAGLASVVLIAVFIGFYFLSSGGGDLAQLNRKDLTNAEEYRNLTNLILISGTYRNSNTAVKLSAGNLTDPVFLRLALPLKGEFFDVNITRNDEKIAPNLRTRAYSNPNGQELRLLLPASDLRAGNYKIEIFSANSQTAPLVYSFVVQ